MDRGAWRAKVHGVTKTERLSMHAWINIWHVFLTTVILPKDLMLWDSDFQTLITAVTNKKRIIHHNLVHVTHMHRNTYT